jgi:hypothetical protein
VRESATGYEEKYPWRTTAPFRGARSDSPSDAFLWLQEEIDNSARGENAWTILRPFDFFL